VTVGPDLTYNGDSDVYVARVRTDGTGFEYCGYIGGSDDENGYGIAIDSQGCAYITGDTWSSESTFPVIAGPDSTLSSYNDAYVAKVTADGTGLEYCGYLGGSHIDMARGIAVDSQNNAYITGYTRSSEDTFPVIAGPDLTYNGSDDYDAFVAKITTALKMQPGIMMLLLGD
jgi:hypothetical protein